MRITLTTELPDYKNYFKQNQTSFRQKKTVLNPQSLNVNKGSNVVKTFAERAKSFLNHIFDNNKSPLEDYIGFQLKQNKTFGNKIPMHCTSAANRREIHSKLKDYPKVLDKIYSTRDHNGKTPLYDIHGENLQDVLNVYSKRKEDLGKLLMIENKGGKIPLHRMYPEEKELVYEYFKDYPEIWTEMNLKSDKVGRCPISHYTCPEEVDMIHNSLKNQPGVLTKLYLKTRGFLGMNGEAAASNVLDFVKTGEVDKENASKLLKKYSKYNTDLLKEIDKL